MIHEAMSGHPRQAVEARADDPHAEVPPFAGARVAGMQVGIIANLQRLGLQGLCQQRLEARCREAFAARAHDCSGVKRTATELMQ